MRLVLFGVSNLLGDILDCALALELTPSLVVMNMPEVVRPRTRSVNDRIKSLEEPPEIIQLEDFSPRQGECYFLGTTSPARRQLVEDIGSRFGITCCTLVHPTAYVSPRACLASGVFVGAGSIIGVGAQLGKHVFINRKVSIGHDTVIESYATVRGGCNLGGHVHVGYGATIGSLAAPHCAHAWRLPHVHSSRASSTGFSTASTSFATPLPSTACPKLA